MRYVIGRFYTISKVNHMAHGQHIKAHSVHVYQKIRNDSRCVSVALLEFCCSLTPKEYSLFPYSQIKLYLVSIISHCVLSPHPPVSSAQSSCFNSDTGTRKNFCTPQHNELKSMLTVKWVHLLMNDLLIVKRELVS